MESLAQWQSLVLIASGILAGCINVLAGGGSLLTLPALMAYGLPADVANGSNRVGVVTQSMVATFGFRKHKKLETRRLSNLLTPTLIGALLGAWLATQIPVGVLKPILLGTMITMATLIAFKKDLFGKSGESVEVDPGRRAYVALFLSGVYGGFVTAGVGFLLLGVLGGLLRFDLVAANAIKVVCVLVFGSAALAIFALAGDVAWLPGLLLAAGTGVGAQIGVRLSLRVHEGTLRKFLLLCVVVVSAAAWFRA